MTVTLLKTDVSAKEKERNAIRRQMEEWEKSNTVTVIPSFHNRPSPEPQRTIRQVIRAEISEARPDYKINIRPEKQKLTVSRCVISENEWTKMATEIFYLIEGRATFEELSVKAGLCSAFLSQVVGTKRRPSLTSAHKLLSAAKTIAGE